MCFCIFVRLLLDNYDELGLGVFMEFMFYCDLGDVGVVCFWG